MTAEAARKPVSSERVAGTAAWFLYALGIAMLVGSGLFSHWTGDALPRVSSNAEDLVWASSWLGFGLVGALIVGRRPTNRIGWLLCGITFGVYLALFVGSYAIYAVLVAADAPLATASLWLAKWMFVPVIAQVVILVLLFPTGTVRGHRRVLLAALLVLFTVESALIALEPLPIDNHPDLMNPLAVGAGNSFMEHAPTIVGYVLAALALLTVVDTIVRARRSVGIEREQFRWFSLAVVLFPVLFVLALVVQATPLWQQGDFDTVIVAFVLGLNAVPVAIGVAVTRYRLFEIDRAVSRTVAYALLTAVLVGVYAAGVLGIGALLRGVGTEGGEFVVAMSTLAVAAVFQPARRRIQSTVDRRFNRERYDGLRTVGAFGHRLRDEVDLATLADELRGVAAATVQPTAVGLWIPEPNSG